MWDKFKTKLKPLQMQLGQSYKHHLPSFRIVVFQRNDTNTPKDSLFKLNKENEELEAVGFTLLVHVYSQKCEYIK